MDNIITFIGYSFTICILLNIQICAGAKLDLQQFQDDSFLEISSMPMDDNPDFYIDDHYETMKSFVPKEPVIESDEYAAPIPEVSTKRPKKIFKQYTNLNRAKKTIFPEGFSAPSALEQDRPIAIKVNQKEKIYVPPPRKSKKYLPPPGSRGNPDRSDGLLSPPFPEMNRKYNENRNRRPQKELLPPPPADMDFIPPIQDQDWKDLVPPMVDQQNYLPPYMQLPDEKYLPPLNQEYLPIGVDFNRDPVQIKNRFNQPKEFSLNENISSRDQFSQNKQAKKYVPPENQYMTPEDQFIPPEKQQFIPSEPDNTYNQPKNENQFNNEDRFVISQPENGYIPPDNDDVYMPPNAEKELMDNQFGQRDFKKQSVAKNNYNPPEQEERYNPQQNEQQSQNQFNPSILEKQYVPPKSENDFNFESEKQYSPIESENQFIPREQEKQFTPMNQENQYIPPNQENQYVPPNQENQYIPPIQEKQYIPPNQENQYTPPNQENQYIPPNQENQYIAPNQEKQYIPPQQNETLNFPNEQNEFIPAIYQNNPFLQRVNKRLKELDRLNQNIVPNENNQRGEQKYSSNQENQYVNEENEKIQNSQQNNQFNPPELSNQYPEQTNRYSPPEQNNQNSKFDQDETKNQYIPPNQYLSPTMRTFIENQYVPSNENSVPQYSQNFVLDPTQPTNDTFLETPMATRRYDSSMYQFPEMMKTAQTKTPSPLAFSHTLVTLQDGSSRSDLRQYNPSNSSQEAPKEVFINPQSKYFTTPEPYYGHQYKNFQSHQIGGKPNQIAMSRSEKGPVNQDNKFELPSVEHLKPTQPSDFIQNHIQSMEQKLAANKMSTLHSQELNQQLQGMTRELQGMESRPVASYTRSYGQPTPFSILPPQSTTEGIPILKQTSEMALDGSFSYETLTGDQTHMMQQGHIENPGTEDEEQVIHGSYSYIGSDGVTYTVHYVADGNGFRASGEHLPTPPPVPDIIQRAIEFNLNEEAERLARELQKQHPHSSSNSNFQNNIQASLDQIRERSSVNKELNNFNNNFFHAI